MLIERISFKDVNKNKTFYPLLLQMKKHLIQIVWLIILVLVIVVAICSRGTAKAINPNSERIAELSYELSELEAHKNICLDNLPYKESVDNANWIHSYCVLYDERIMAVQEELENLKERRPAASETETAWTAEVQENREPWMVSWNQQVMPNVVADTSHERFKEMCNAYWLDASTIWNVENHYGIKEWVILCITVAETSGWHNWAWGKNIGSVGSNDRWDRPTYALMEAWLEDIWKTLNNRYLGKIQTLWCLSNWGSCQSWDDNWKRYATSNWNWERNMTACLSKIYWSINPKVFSIRR